MVAAVQTAEPNTKATTTKPSMFNTLSSLWGSSADTLYWRLSLVSSLLVGITFVVGFWTVRVGARANKRQSRDLAVFAAKLAEQSRLTEEQRERAAKAEKSVLELQAKFTPRLVTGENRAKFLAALSNATRGKVNVSVVSGDPEAFTFASQLRDTLQGAGFDVGPILGSFMLFGAPVVGVQVCIANEANKPPHAFSIRAALDAIGVKTDGIAPYGSEPDVVNINIGTKP
jgi:hypothetical protein